MIILAVRHEGVSACIHPFPTRLQFARTEDLKEAPCPEATRSQQIQRRRMVRPNRPAGAGDGPPLLKIHPECGTTVVAAASVSRQRGDTRTKGRDPEGTVDEYTIMGRCHRPYLDPPQIHAAEVLAKGRLLLRFRLPHWMGRLRRERQPSRKAKSWWREQAVEQEVPEAVDEAINIVDGWGRPVEFAIRFTELTAQRFAPGLAAVPVDAPYASFIPATMGCSAAPQRRDMGRSSRVRREICRRR